MKKQSAHVISILLIVTLLLSACNFKNPFAAKDKVNVQLSWFHSVEYAGFYTAIEKGYYSDENIETNLIVGGPTVDSLSEVKNGNAQFGITTGDSLVVARSNQENFVAVATVFRHSPLVAISLRGNNIKKPEDLVGKNIGTISSDLSSTYDVQFLAVLNQVLMLPMTFQPLKTMTPPLSSTPKVGCHEWNVCNKRTSSYK
ncbi:MAG: ABC transporter substrate-binding protein [Anaerolineales bacterium]